MFSIDAKQLIPLGSIWFHAHDAEKRRRKEWFVRSVSGEAVVLVANETVRSPQTYDNVCPFGGPLEMTLSPEVLLLVYTQTDRRAVRYANEG